jgi:hypothetical protein
LSGLDEVNIPFCPNCGKRPKYWIGLTIRKNNKSRLLANSYNWNKKRIFLLERNNAAKHMTYNSLLVWDFDMKGTMEELESIVVFSCNYLTNEALHIFTPETSLYHRILSQMKSEFRKNGGDDLK